MKADLDEGVRCSICRQFYCQDDCVADTCRSCAQLLPESGGRVLTAEEISVLRERRPSIRRGSIVESSRLLLGFFGVRGVVMPEGCLLRGPVRALAEDLEVVAVVHDADDVAERVDDRRGDKPGAALPNAVELPGSERE
jgi:hypothetical protein